jgi:putative flippase GtrA
VLTESPVNDFNSGVPRYSGPTSLDLAVTAAGRPCDDLPQVTGSDQDIDETVRQPGRPGRSGKSGGRHAARQGNGHGHGRRFTTFALTGGVVFVLGLATQAVLTGLWHIPALATYLAQAVVSVEVSFLLNRRLTWRDRDIALWTAFARFNAQKIFTIALNSLIYAGLLHAGMNYLAANVVLTVVFAVINYAAGDLLVFSRVRPGGSQGPGPGPGARPAPADGRPGASGCARRPARSGPAVSVVIPCRGNEATIGAAVQSLLDQDYPNLSEILLIGSPDDSTWRGLAGICDPRLRWVEIAAPPGRRDANFKRDAGIRLMTGELVAMIDSDIVLPPDWLTVAVTALQDNGVSCVAGGMKSIHDSFWGRYADNTVVGAKTPRIPDSYLVTKGSFGTGGRKPPITANALFTRELYDACPIDPSWSHGSYEDYEWFWRVTSAGYSVLVCSDLFGWHHHRRGLVALVREYRRSSRGCAYFIRAHQDCPLARRRLLQAILLPLAAIAAGAAIAAAAADGESSRAAGLVLVCMLLLAAQQVTHMRMRRLEAVAYPVAGLALGLVFTTGLVTSLMLSAAQRTGASAILDAAAPAPDATAQDGAVAPGSAAPLRPGPARRRLRYPLAAICVVQAALSLSLVWSNTAFGDEAEYLWIGRLVWAHWLHGAPLPPIAAHLSASSLLYPPLGALANSIGGLAGARILSLAFMLGATVLLYLTAERLIGGTGALFAAGLWALTEPVIRLAFATYDPLSVLLTALSAWLIAEAGFRRRRGELVAAAAAALALANATAFSGVIIDPVVITFAFLAWRSSMGSAQAASATAWLAGGFAAFVCLALTVTHSWAATTSIFARTSPDHQPVLLVITDVWQYSGLVLVVAMAGVAAALGAADRRRTWLVVLLGLAAFLVPAGQLAEQTGWSLDKHLAYGIWFAAIAGGYACSTLIRRLPRCPRSAVAVCCGLAMLYPAVNGWESAWNIYHSWQNASGFVTALRSAVSHSRGSIDVAGQQYVAQYYLPQGNDWQRWDSAGISLDPATLPAGSWRSYYAGHLASGRYGVIALFYAAPPGVVTQRAQASLLTGHPATHAKVTELAGLGTGQLGIPDLTSVLVADRAYRLAAVGSYDTDTLASNHEYGFYAVWVRKTPG